MDADRGGREERFGHYTLLRQLGRGGQGAVWLAEDLRLGRRVALKLLNAGPGSLSSGQITRFRREAEAASRLDHPNICGLLDVGDVDGVPYLAFRYVPGKTLAQRIAEATKRRHAESGEGEKGAKDESSTDPVSKAGFREVVSTFEKIARALHQAHEAGLIHRDVKPGNLMVTEDGEPVVLDFGLAREELGGEGLSLTQSGDLLGTPAYMSPEQLMAHRVPLDRRTDVYSLGASMYQALTLRVPFQALTRAELYQQILHADPPSASGLNRQIPRDLQVVLETAMEKDRDRRYQTALDLAEDLRRCREFEPIRARPIGRVLRAKRWVQRHPTAAVTMALLSIGIVASLFALARIRGQLRTRTALNRVAESRQLLDVDPVSALELALEAYALRPGALETVTQLHRVLGEGLPTTVVRDGSWRGGIGIWSPDGGRMLHVGVREPHTWNGTLACSDADLRVVEPRFGDTLFLGYLCGFSSSGDFIFGVDTGDRLRAWNEKSGEPVEVEYSGQVSAVEALSADDQLVLQSPTGDLALIDLESGASLPLPADLPAVSSNVATGQGGPTFAVGLADKTLAVFSSHALVSRSEPLAEPAVRVAFAGESGRTVGVQADGSAAMWDPASGSFQPLPDSEGTIDAEFSHDGRWLLTFHESGVAKLRDGTGPVLHVLERPDGSKSGFLLRNLNTPAVPRHFSDSTTRPRICTLYMDLATAIWDLRGRHVRTLPGIPGFSTNWAEWSADGSALVLSQGPPAVRVVDPDGDESARLAPALKASVSPDGSRVFLRGFLWALPDPDVPWIQAHGASVRGLAAGDSGRIVATASDDQTVRLWRRRAGAVEALSEYTTSSQVGVVVLDPTGELLLFGSFDGHVQLRRTSDSAVLFDQRFGPANSRGFYTQKLVNSVGIAPDGGRFAVSVSGETHVYDVRSGDRLFTIPEGVTGIQWTERHLFLACQSGGLLLTAAGERVAEFGEPGTFTRDARLSPEEDVVACVQRSEIWVYERSPSGTWPESPSAVLAGHDGGVYCLRFHPDGERIVTASVDGTARIWSLSERRELAVLEGHVGPVRAAVFVDGGERILTTGADGTIRTWIVDEEDLLEVARRRWEAVRR